MGGREEERDGEVIRSSYCQRFYSETSAHLVGMAGTEVDLNKISVRELGV